MLAHAFFRLLTQIIAETLPFLKGCEPAYIFWLLRQCLPLPSRLQEHVLRLNLYAETSAWEAETIEDFKRVPYKGFGHAFSKARRVLVRAFMSPAVISGAKLTLAHLYVSGPGQSALILQKAQWMAQKQSGGLFLRSDPSPGVLPRLDKRIYFLQIAKPLSLYCQA